MERRTVLKARTKTAVAEHIKDGECDVVSIGDLRVVITRDNDWWLAQAIEVDYAAQGRTLNEAKGNFEHGLALLIDSYLEDAGSIKEMLKFAPAETWKDLVDLTWSGLFKYSQTSVHEFPRLDALPFAGIAYYEQRDAA